MMQLLPGTAKEVAKKAKFNYSVSRLLEANYNFTLGSHYLNRLVENYDGSYVLAIAAYNAGPGNVREWRRYTGSIGSTPEQAIDWIERIPFPETRNYVQRVIENLEVYRNLESGDAPPTLHIAEDLTR
jgi:soluble lytic murein transglycosylase